MLISAFRRVSVEAMTTRTIRYQTTISAGAVSAVRNGHFDVGHKRRRRPGALVPEMALDPIYEMPGISAIFGE